MNESQLARFMPKFYVDEETGCWVWTAAKAPSGHPGFCLGRPEGKRWVQAHRVSYEHFVGPIPEGLELDHLCVNPPCVNPAHLEPVTHAENMRRGIAG